MTTYSESKFDFDFLVIGGGPGGYVSAIKAAQSGMKTALIEKEDLGGVCLNWGCIPTKALLKTADLYDGLKESDSFGIEIDGKPRVDLKKAVARSRKISQGLKQGVTFLLKKNKVHVIEGHGRFKDPHTVEVTSKEGKVHNVTSKNVVIATGARPRILPQEKNLESFFWSSKEAMLCEDLPKSLVVIGSGAIGMEFASFFNALGTKTSVVELMDRILPQEDSEISSLAQKAFEKKGITFYKGSTCENFTREGTRIKVEVVTKEPKTSHTIVADKILVAIGIEANSGDLGLENTKVKTHKGHIVTSGFSQTDEPSVFAIGDVATPPWLAHKASHEGLILVRHLMGERVDPLDVTLIPSCIYSSPQVASVGLTEAKAKEMGYEVRVGEFPFQANGKALALGKSEGLIKTIFDAKTGELLGAHMIGAEVTELVQGFAIARTLEATEEGLMEVIFPHPTLSEMMGESIHHAFGLAIHSA